MSEETESCAEIYSKPWDEPFKYMKKTIIVYLRSNKSYPELKMTLRWTVPLEKLPEIVSYLEKVGISYNVKKKND